ncbi:acetyltransferase [Paenibacillus sp. NEAU-GSW1]|uniref:acetyltransferase n=1 Tax=Paenibacillus sp. NEAU-GSW1 TaxID=2682486 RepID=UPI0012E1F4EE|nr:acetyltransferase [Paenibacillus sp. NEAU-GSW1]MUT65004.1 sugar acetyltransferase [Paenibacillus sp. NEAU-GSW1]
MKPVILIGGGGHAKVCLDLLLRQQSEIVGYTALQASSSLPDYIAYLGDDEAVLRYEPGEVMLVNGIGMLGSSRIRSRIYARYKKAGYTFASLIHDSAVVSNLAEVCEGAQIMAGAVVQAGSVIGANVIVNTRAVIDHDCTIGKHAHISPGAVLCGGVTVGEHVHVGAGANVVQQVSIGDEAVIGAGSLVLRPVDSCSLVYGVPAKRADSVME